MRQQKNDLTNVPAIPIDEVNHELPQKRKWTMKHFSRKKLPIDVQAFEIMRGEDYVYVDKTRHISKMITERLILYTGEQRKLS